MSKLNPGACLGRSLAVIAMLALCYAALAEEPAAPATAATPKPSLEKPKRGPRPNDIQKVFVIKDATVRELAEVLSIFPAAISYDHTRFVNSQGVSSSATALGVSAPPAVMAAIEETIKRLDVPPAPKKSVEITAYILEALSAPQADAKVPAVLDPVVAQLKNTFRYADYRLVDTLIARAVADGQTRLDASSFSEADIWPQGKARYRLRARPVLLTSDSQRVVRMEHMQFTFNLPIELAGQMVESGIEADVDIRDGQTIVVGKSGTGQPGSALILVLHAAIVD